MSFNCPSCSFTTKYKCSLDRHVPKCKGDSHKKSYFCEVCGGYSTRNKTHFDKHQQSSICKKYAEVFNTHEKRIAQLERIVKAHENILKPLIYE